MKNLLKKLQSLLDQANSPDEKDRIQWVIDFALKEKCHRIGPYQDIRHNLIKICHEGYIRSNFSNTATNTDDVYVGSILCSKCEKYVTKTQEAVLCEI